MALGQCGKGEMCDILMSFHPVFFSVFMSTWRAERCQNARSWIPFCPEYRLLFVFLFQPFVGCNEIFNLKHILLFWWPALVVSSSWPKMQALCKSQIVHAFFRALFRPVGIRYKPPFARQLRMLNAYWEGCPVQAAKALKKAMESGNVDVLKEAIAVAKEQKVSQEAGKWQWGFVTFANLLHKVFALQKSAAGGWWLFSCLYASCRICWKLWRNTWHWPQKYVLLLVDPAFQTFLLTWVGRAGCDL